MVPNRPLELPLPPDMRRYWLSQPWGRLHLVAGGQGPPLVLVHGLGGSCQDFFVMAQYLAPGYTLLIPDLPGFGRSSKPEAPYGPAFFAGVLAEMAAQLGLGRAHWLGHSLGGATVLSLALEHPALLRRLVALCPHGGQVGPTLLQRQLLSRLTNRDDRLRVFLPWLVDLGVYWCYGDPSQPSRRELTRRLRSQWSTAERPLLERSFIRAARNALANPLWPRLGELAAPLLLIEGARDRVIPAANLARLARRMPPGSQHLRLPCGHLPLYTMPYRLSRLVEEFLARG